MRRTFRDESSCKVLHGTEFGDDTLCLLVLKEGDEFLEFTCSTKKVCTMVAPYQGGLASASDKSSKGGNECVCSVDVNSR